MKKVLIAVCFLGLAVSATAAPLLVEKYQQEKITIPIGEMDTVSVIELSLSIDSARCVLFTTGGLASMCYMWLDLDGEQLLSTVPFDFSARPAWFTIPYSYLLEAGNHTITLWLASGGSDNFPATCEQAYLQALIFLPDAGGAIAERPAGDVDAEPTGEMTSVISKGPYVHVTGATELVDATGRVIEDAITNDKVSISNLPQGTYFARDGERTVVKIVKVD